MRLILGHVGIPTLKPHTKSAQKPFSPGNGVVVHS